MTLCAAGAAWAAPVCSGRRWAGGLRLPWLTRNCVGSRSFYLALYKQMSFLEKRGCPRTALEFCKLILR